MLKRQPSLGSVGLCIITNSHNGLLSMLKKSKGRVSSRETRLMTEYQHQKYRPFTQIGLILIIALMMQKPNMRLTLELRSPLSRNSSIKRLASFLENRSIGLSPTAFTR